MRNKIKMVLPEKARFTEFIVRMELIQVQGKNKLKRINVFQGKQKKGNEL